MKMAAVESSTLFILMTTFIQLYAHKEDAGENPCPKFWVQATHVDLGCLLFNSSTTYTWPDANTYCQEQENATLVEILTEEQLELIQMELYVLENESGAHQWWIGGTDMGNEGDWFWIKSKEPVAEFIWHQGQPAQGFKGDCAALWSGGYNYEGDDNSCTRLLYPICQQMII